MITKFTKEIEEIEAEAKKSAGYIEFISKQKQQAEHDEKMLAEKREYWNTQTDNIIFATVDSLVKQGRLISFELSDKVTLEFRLKATEGND